MSLLNTFGCFIRKWPAYVLLFFILLTCDIMNSAIVKFVSLAYFTAAFANLSLKAAAHFVPTGTIANTSKKAVFITGCDSGFGWLLAQKLDKMGFHVFAGCLFPTKEGGLELQTLCSKRLQVLHVDVINEFVVAQAVQQVHTALEATDIQLWAVVNNAGIAVTSEVELCPIEQFQQIYDVNAMGTVRVTKKFLPLLRKSHGRVVIVASFAGRYTFFGISAYCMSKHAAVSFADCLRLEMAKFGVTVHTIEPYFYATRICDVETKKIVVNRNWANVSEEVRDAYGDQYFQAYLKSMDRVKRVGRTNLDEVVSDMADAVSSLQPKNRYIPYFLTEIWNRVAFTFPSSVMDIFSLIGRPLTKPNQQ